MWSLHPHSNASLDNVAPLFSSSDSIRMPPEQCDILKMFLHAKLNVMCTDEWLYLSVYLSASGRAVSLYFFSYLCVFPPDCMSLATRVDIVLHSLQGDRLVCMCVCVHAIGAGECWKRSR